MIEFGKMFGLAAFVAGGWLFGKLVDAGILAGMAHENCDEDAS